MRGNFLDSTPDARMGHSIFKRMNPALEYVDHMIRGVTVDLSNNSLSSLEYIGGLKLRDFGFNFNATYLILSDNAIFGLPGKGAFESLTYLSMLDLKGNPIELDKPMGEAYTVMNQEHLPPKITTVCPYKRANSKSASRAERHELAQYMAGGMLPAVLSDLINEYFSNSGVIYSSYSSIRPPCHRLAGRIFKYEWIPLHVQNLMKAHRSRSQPLFTIHESAFKPTAKFLPNIPWNFFSKIVFN